MVEIIILIRDDDNFKTDNTSVNLLKLTFEITNKLNVGN